MKEKKERKVEKSESSKATEMNKLPIKDVSSQMPYKSFFLIIDR